MQLFIHSSPSPGAANPFYAWSDAMHQGERFSCADVSMLVDPQSRNDSSGSSQRSGSPLRFRVADWTVDQSTDRVIRGREEVKLEPRVMDLLAYLALHAGQVVTRDELEVAVWTGMVVSYDAIAGSVQKLRRALGDDPREPRFVETIAKRFEGSMGELFALQDAVAGRVVASLQLSLAAQAGRRRAITPPASRPTISSCAPSTSSVAGCRREVRW